MNDKSETAPGSQGGSDQKSSAKADESPGQSSSHTTQERSSLFDWLAGYFKQRNGNTLREDIADALAENESDAVSFSPEERQMLGNILRLREVRVEDVMVPRADIEAIEIGTSLAELLVHFEESGHSRMPVYADSLDDPRGMVHIRDVVAYITRAARARKGRARKGEAVTLNLAGVDLSKSIGDLKLMRTVLFVPPSMLASELMTRMQATRTQIAMVIDEYGGTDGLASLEDLVEMIVGDIEDEHDEDEALITTTDDGAYIVDGKAEIEDVQDALGDDFQPGEFGENVDTVGGILVNAAGRVPRRGAVLHAVPGFEMQVLDADLRRVKRVRITRVADRERRRAASQ